MDDKMREVVIAKVTASPKKSIRRTSLELGIPQETVRRILKAEKFHLHKLQILHNLTEDNPDRQFEMCEWLSNRVDEYDRFTEDCVVQR
jgi:hypothetical protein